MVKCKTRNGPWFDWPYRIIRHCSCLKHHLISRLCCIHTLRYKTLFPVGLDWNRVRGSHCEKQLHSAVLWRTASLVLVYICTFLYLLFLTTWKPQQRTKHSKLGWKKSHDFSGNRTQAAGSIIQFSTTEPKSLVELSAVTCCCCIVVLRPR